MRYCLHCGSLADGNEKTCLVCGEPFETPTITDDTFSKDVSSEKTKLLVARLFLSFFLAAILGIIVGVATGNIRNKKDDDIKSNDDNTYSVSSDTSPSSTTIATSEQNPVEKSTGDANDTIATTETTTENTDYIGKGFVNTESTELNLRSAPDKTSDILIGIPKNTQLDIFDSGERGWYYTEYNGKKGYVSADYIAFDLDSIENGTPIFTCNKYGRINTHGGNLPSITLDYITGGEWKTLRDSLGNGWHIKAVRYCQSMDITWYEIYDADDGDYYGWIDGAFIDFDS